MSNIQHPDQWDENPYGPRGKAYPNPYKANITNPHDTWPQSKSKTEPKVITISDLFPRLDRWAIGFDPVFATLKALSLESKASSYPPYNVMKFGDDKFELRIAVAGFSREELEVSIKERTLTVKADTEFKPGNTYEVKTGEMLHQGIAERDFTLNFALAEFIEVDSVSLVDGILTVKLELKLPKEKQSKRIDIK